MMGEKDLGGGKDLGGRAPLERGRPPSKPPSPENFPRCCPGFCIPICENQPTGAASGKIPFRRGRQRNDERGRMAASKYRLLARSGTDQSTQRTQNKNRTFRTSCRRMPAKHDWKTKKRAPAVCGMSVSRFKSDCQAQSKDDRRITICDPPKPETAPAPSRAFPVQAPQPPLFHKQIPKPEPVPGKFSEVGGSKGGRLLKEAPSLRGLSFFRDLFFPHQAISPT